jgi:hypothetical protein
MKAITILSLRLVMEALPVRQHNRSVLGCLEAGDLVEVKGLLYNHWAVYIGIDFFLSYYFKCFLCPENGETCGFYGVRPSVLPSFRPSSELCLIYNFVIYRWNLK